MTTEALAIDGGKPVRTDRLPYGRGLTLFGAEEREAAAEVIEARSLFRYYGPNLLGKVEAFETALASYVGAPHAVALSSGTAALRAGLAALGVGCGDEVIVPCFTFIASVNAIVAAGAVPVFCEIDESLNADPEDIEAKITEKTVAVMPVHLENQAADMDRIMEIARRRGIAVIEDACQAIGSTYHGKHLGTIGDVGCYSLQLEKNITSGEGGVLLAADDKIFVRAARYSDQGGQFVTSYGVERGEELEEPFCGENLRITEIGGAIALEQLKKLPGLIDRFRMNKRKILDALGNVDGIQIRKNYDPEGDGSSSLQWFLPSADLVGPFIKAMFAEGVPCGQIYNGKPVYTTPSILAKRTASNKGGPWHCAEHPTDVEYKLGMCPRSEDLASRMVATAVGHAFTPSDCEDVAAAITKVASHIVQDGAKRLHNNG